MKSKPPYHHIYLYCIMFFLKAVLFHVKQKGLQKIAIHFLQSQKRKKIRNNVVISYSSVDGSC